MPRNVTESGESHLSEEILSTASLLRKEAVESEPAILRAYLFPAPDEVRLIHVDSTIAPLPAGESIAPFHFGAAPEYGIRLRSAVALIAPEDDRSAPLPDGWGTWESATIMSDHD